MKCNNYMSLRIEFLNHISHFCDLQSMSINDIIKLCMCDNKIINRFSTFIRNCWYKRINVNCVS